MPSVSDHTSTNDPWGATIKNESVRYQQKGYGIVVAAIIAFSFMYFTPRLFKSFWPYLLENIPSTYIFVMFAIGTHTGMYVISNLMMWGIYKARIPFLERYRVSDQPWPWESNPEAWNRTLKKTLGRVAIYHFLVIPGLTLIGLITGINVKIDMEHFPSTTEIVVQIIFFMLCEDFFFYWTHRLLHHPRFYSRFHKTHHEYNNTVSFASEYCHPVEFYHQSYCKQFT